MSNYDGKPVISNLTFDISNNTTNISICHVTTRHIKTLMRKIPSFAQTYAQTKGNNNEF